MHNYYLIILVMIHIFKKTSAQNGVNRSTRRVQKGDKCYCEQIHHTKSQMKHQLDATLCRIYFCRVTLHVSGASAHHQEYLILVQRPLVHVLSLQVSHHISLLGPEMNASHSIPALITSCDDLPATITHVPVSAVLVINTPDAIYNTMYNYMFRPCMKAIIRLFKEYIKWLQGMCGNFGRGMRFRLTS